MLYTKILICNVLRAACTRQPFRAAKIAIFSETGKKIARTFAVQPPHAVMPALCTSIVQFHTLERSERGESKLHPIGQAYFICP